MENLIQYGHFYFTKDTDEAFMKFINTIYETHRTCRIKIVYNKGWEDFSGYHGGDGLHHSIYIGRSTGSKPIPLAIYRRDSTGGPALLTNSKAIKRYGI